MAAGQALLTPVASGGWWVVGGGWWVEHRGNVYSRVSGRDWMRVKWKHEMQ